MGAYILLAVATAILAFTIFTHMTRTEQHKVKSLLRIAALAAFLALLLTGAIHWSARWYLLAALLAVWGALGAWFLMRPRIQDRPYSVRRAVFGALGTLLIAGAAGTPALIFPEYRMPEVTGSFKVATVTETFVDPQRPEIFSPGEQRFVNVECWYPVDGAGAYPLVVFSHGAFGIRASNTSTYIELASHGYVVCSVDHPYHSFYTRHPSGRIILVNGTFMQEVMDANTGKYDDRGDWALIQKWLRVRVDDIHFVLDTLLERSADANSSEAYRLIDATRVGLMGHSLGAAASAQAARERGDIRAVIDLDSDLLGEYVDFADGKPVRNPEVFPAPLLTVYTDDMLRVIAKNEALGITLAGLEVTARSKDAFEIHLPGTHHLSVTDLTLTSPFLAHMVTGAAGIGGGEETEPLEVLEALNAVVLAFFDAYLKGEGTFHEAAQ